MKTAHYYATVPVSPREHEQFTLIAMGQEELVLALFQKYPQGTFTCRDVQRFVPELQRAPVTSVGRAIVCLTRAGKLVKCGVRVSGPYKRPVNVWRLA